MGLFKSMGRGFKKSWQPKRWVDYDSIKKNAGLIKSLANSTFKVRKQNPTNYSSFTEAMQGMGIDDEKLKAIIKRSAYSSFIYLAVSILIFFYMVFLIFSSRYMPAFSCFFLMLIALCFSFRESYTCFLFKTRKLRSTFKSWLKFMVFSK